MYIIEELREDVPKALGLVYLSTILGHYKICLKKMDLYAEKVVYGTGEWKKLRFHKKIQDVNDNK